jgi:tetratricopeptide (TPR) repeat protein
MTRVSPQWLLLFLLSASFTLATVVQPRLAPWELQADSGGIVKVLLGDSRRLLADQFLEQADVSFHSGFYPSIFDERKPRKETGHMTSKEGSPEAEAHEHEMNFMGTPRDWIERFGRHFMITEHTHLEGGNEREILPWLRISAELDPHKIDTYTVASYWLRNSMGKVPEAEQFLREGLRNNPQSYELWYELGLLYDENRHDSARARNAWELALRYWNQSEPAKAEPDRIGWEKIVVRLANLEEKTGNLTRALEYLKLVLQHSPNPDAIRDRISELEKQQASGHGTNSLSSNDKK